MNTLLSVVGTRPNFIKLDPTLPQIIVHTGQHYDDKMSDLFFRDLHLPKPEYNLNLKQSQVGLMIQGLEKVYENQKPALVLVYGDTNSTAAGAIAAYQKRIPVAHVEAGLRSGNRQMLEEFNRIISDHIADYNFCPTATAVHNLRHEGLTNTFFTGDVMYDLILRVKKSLGKLEQKDHVLFTCHRAETVDDKKLLDRLLTALGKVKRNILFPIHPRTKRSVRRFKIRLANNIKPVEPLSYSETIKAAIEAAAVITDSGGLQKEAYFLQKPCVIIRSETEWPEIVDGKSILLLEPGNWQDLPNLFRKNLPKPTVNKDLFGDGTAWKKIRRVLQKEGFL